MLLILVESDKCKLFNSGVGVKTLLLLMLEVEVAVGEEGRGLLEDRVDLVVEVVGDEGVGTGVGCDGASV